MFIIFFYLIAISLTVLVFIKFFVPEMRKAPHVKPPVLDEFVLTQEDKTQMMLAEKLKLIHALQTELKILKAKEKNFDTIKEILEQQIQHLKEENRSLRTQTLLTSTSL